MYQGYLYIGSIPYMWYTTYDIVYDIKYFVYIVVSKICTESRNIVVREIQIVILIQ